MKQFKRTLVARRCWLVLLCTGIGLRATAQSARSQLGAQLVQRVKARDAKGAQRLLLRGASPDARDYSGRFLWQKQAQQRVQIWNSRTRRRETMANGATMKPFVGPTVLMIAAWQNDVPLARVLLDAGAKRNLTGVDFGAARSNSLDVDVETRVTSLYEAMMADSPAMMRLLLRRGARVNARMSDGLTALDVAYNLTPTSLPTPARQRLLDHVFAVLRAFGAKRS